MKKIIPVLIILTICPLFASQIHEAIAQNKKSKLMKILIGYLGNPEKLEEDINAENLKGQTPLYVAVMKNNLKIADLILMTGGKKTINAHDTSGKTPLYIAVANHHVEMTHFLLSNGSAFGPLDSRFPETLQPLYKAVQDENLYMVKLLIFCGASVSDEIRKFKDDNIFLLSKIKRLISHPEKIEEYCSKDEIKKFEEIKLDRYKCLAALKSRL